MRARVFSLLLVFCLPAWMSAQVDAPKIGAVRYSDKSIHIVSGLHNDFIVNAQTAGSADAASFSDSGGLLAKNGQIQLLGPDATVIAEYDSNESAPLLNIDGDLSTAIAWLPNHHALLHWNGKSFVLVEIQSGLLTRVSSVRLQDSKTAELLITEPGGVVSSAIVSLDTGDVVSLHLLPGVHGPAFRQLSYVVFHDERGLEIASANGAVRTLPLTAPDLTFERISSDWLHLASPTTQQNWILHLNDTTLELSELPGPPSAVQQEVHK